MSKSMKVDADLLDAIKRVKALVDKAGEEGKLEGAHEALHGLGFIAGRLRTMYEVVDAAREAKKAALAALQTNDAMLLNEGLLEVEQRLSLALRQLDDLVGVVPE